MPNIYLHIQTHVHHFEYILGDIIPTYPKMYILGNIFKHTGILVFFDYCRRLIMEPNSAEVALSNMVVFLKTRPRFHALFYYKLCIQTILMDYTHERDTDDTSQHYLLHEDDEELLQFEEKLIQMKSDKPITPSLDRVGSIF